MQTLNQMSQNNPQVKKVLDYIQNNGGDAKAAFYNYARENNLDANQALVEAKSLFR